jgi:hypothetical protein
LFHGGPRAEVQPAANHVELGSQANPDRSPVGRTGEAFHRRNAPQVGFLVSFSARRGRDAYGSVCHFRTLSHDDDAAAAGAEEAGDMVKRNRTDPMSRGPVPFRPHTVADLLPVLARLVDQASGWTDELYELRPDTLRLAGTGATASLDVACRRMEDAVIELQIVLDDAKSTRRPHH